MNNVAFVWFEFDKAVALLWQSLNEPTPKTTFAYQAKLRALTQNSPDWGVGLESLKVLDVFLSAVKSDLASRHVKEHELLSHPEFVKMLMLIVHHVAKVLDNELAKFGQVSINHYASRVFGRIYARTFAHAQGSALSEGELLAFYQGLGTLVECSSPTGAVADRLFVLSVIGARLFGSSFRTFKDLDNTGALTVAVEDSLYWAVSDMMARLPNQRGGEAKHLFEKPTQKTPTITIPEPVQTDTHTPPQTPALQSAVQTTHEPISPAPSQPKPVEPISQRKQKARASHTPKLFSEVYHDLRQLPSPADSDPNYQPVKAVLDKIDAHINAELSSGKALGDIGFNDKSTQVYKQAIQRLSACAKAGNMSAMTRLAVYLFEGRGGLPINIPTATKLIKQCADMGDIRAQKLLSRLYYQGFAPDEGGIQMNAPMGEQWLIKSAEGGHPESKKVRAYMTQVEILKSTQRLEVESDRRYLLWGAVCAGGLVLILLVMMAFT